MLQYETHIGLEDIFFRSPHYYLKGETFKLTVEGRKYTFIDNPSSKRNVFYGSLEDQNNPQNNRDVLIKISTSDEMVTLRYVSNLEEKLSPYAKIAKFIEADFNEYEAVIVSEKVLGCTVEDYFFSKNDPDNVEVLTLVHKMLSSFIIMANHDLIYTDFTLANFMITDDNNELVLIDFDTCYLNKKISDTEKLQTVKERVSKGHFNKAKKNIYLALKSVNRNFNLGLTSALEKLNESNLDSILIFERLARALEIKLNESRLT